MLVIIGESASGKSTLQNMLIEENNNWSKVITYTTRPKRENEVDGVDYHFISQDDFNKYVEEGFFIEHAKYRDWSYGTAKSDCMQAENKVAVLTPSGLRSLKKANAKVTSVYLYVDRRSRLESILYRGDNIDEAYRRNLSDVGQFDGVINEVDYVIDNKDFHMDEIQVLECLLKILEDADEGTK